ncbi:MAG: nucleotidyltransferase domain-containing protein [Nitrospinae bacterium]|nr:nucleotidyltransferase domain-containing protein [Nitrospinota bacterium]
MAKKEIVKISKILRELLKQRGIDIYKIVIFGSYAKKRVSRDSDIDMMIISKDFRNKDIFERVELAGGVHRELVKRFKKPFDIMYYSDKEWNRGFSLIMNTAKREGNIIYG